MRRRASNWQERAKDFRVGQAVTMVGDRLYSEGRVLAVWPAIGMCDVQYPTGSVRLPVEDLQIIHEEEDEYVTPMHSDVPGGTGTVPVPKARAASSVTPRYKGKSRMDAGAVVPKNVWERLQEQVRRLAKMWAEDTFYAKGRGPFRFDEQWAERAIPSMNLDRMTHLLLSQVAEKAAAQRWEELMREKDEGEDAFSLFFKGSRARNIVALYWNQKDRQYRCTRSEFDSNAFTCPKCSTPMKATVYKREKGKSVRLLGCPGCMFLIRRQDILDDHCQVCE